MKNALTVKPANKNINPELARKFERAKQRKVSIDNFVHDFLGRFVS